MGLNYLDMAPSYNQGQCEEAYGKLLAGSSAKREKVFLNQQNGFNLAYLRAAMLKDYRHKVEGSGHCRKFITESLEASLKRVGTDYFDIVMCPHGANSPEDLECPEIIETFQQLKKQGKARFLGVTSHNDPAGVLRAATAAGYYDVAMFAYNVII